MSDELGRGRPPLQIWFRGLLRGWKQPGDVTSLLMIASGDVVQQALAQLSGTTLVPVAFSLGWVLYCVQAFTTAIGTGRLMPAAPDVQIMVVNIKSGYARANRSWILGRLFRDWDYGPLKAGGLYITVLDAVSREDFLDQGLDVQLASPRLGRAPLLEPELGLGNTESKRTTPLLKRWTHRVLAKMQCKMRGMQIWYQEQGPVLFFAWAMIVTQWIVALLPLIIDHEASTFLLTVAGTCLALAFGSRSRWRREKWCDRAKSSQDFCLLEGNGGQHVMVVRGNGVGRHFEDLAGGQVLKGTHTAACTLIFAISWIALLIVMAREEGQTWYLMIVMGLGILQNIVVAGAPRPPSAFRFYLKNRKTFHDDSVRNTLCQAEKEIENLGLSLRPIFFPGTATPADDEAFEEAVATRKKRKEQAVQVRAREAEMQEASSSGRDGAEANSTSRENRAIHQGGEQ